jgi:PAS domain S-box-containing protein
MNGRILIVDDEETLCYFLKESLEEKGYRTVAVHTATNGLAQLASEPVDLVLLDLKLPDGEGLDVLQEIRKVDGDLPVIVLTGHAAVDSAVRAMKLGAYDYLEKPINLAQLSRSVAEALDSSRERAAVEEERPPEAEAKVGLAAIEAEAAQPELEEPIVRIDDLAAVSRTLREVESNLKKADALIGLWTHLGSCVKVSEITETAAEHLIALAQIDLVAVFVGGHEEGDLVLASQRRSPPGLWDDPRLRRIPLDGVLAHTVTRWDLPRPLSEAGPDPWVDAVSDGLGAEVTTAVVPLREGGRLRGLLLVGGRGHRPYVRQEMGFFRRLGEGLVPAIGRAQTMASLQERLDWISDREERQRLLLENLSEGLVSVDGQGCIRLLNQAAERLLRCAEEEALGHEVEDLLGDHAAMVRDSLDRHLAYPLQEISLEDKGGERSLLMGVSPLWLDRGATDGAVICLADLTRFKEAEEERIRAERLDVLADISAVVAHEIRNPLAGMAAGIQHLLTKVEEDDDKHQALQRILKEGERVNQVIENILLITRPPHLDLELCDLSEMVREVVSEWEVRAHSQGVQFGNYYCSGLLPVKADRKRLSQALGNLLLNGMEAMPDGGKLDISVTGPPAEGDGYAEVEIRDSGAGIGDEDRERVFEAFYTTKPRSAGLGLTIAQRIVNEHGGEIDIESGEGKGTAVIVRLPVAGRVAQ